MAPFKQARLKQKNDNKTPCRKCWRRR